VPPTPDTWAVYAPGAFVLALGVLNVLVYFAPDARKVGPGPL